MQDVVDLVGWMFVGGWTLGFLIANMINLYTYTKLFTEMIWVLYKNTKYI